MAFYNETTGNSGGSSGAVILATDSGDHQNFTLAGAATTSQYFAGVNGGAYFRSDSQFGFSVSGTVLAFISAMDATTASGAVGLICV